MLVVPRRLPGARGGAAETRHLSGHSVQLARDQASPATQAVLLKLHKHRRSKYARPVIDYSYIIYQLEIQLSAKNAANKN